MIDLIIENPWGYFKLFLVVATVFVTLVFGLHQIYLESTWDGEE